MLSSTHRCASVESPGVPARPDLGAARRYPLAGLATAAARPLSSGTGRRTAKSALGVFNAVYAAPAKCVRSAATQVRRCWPSATSLVRPSGQACKLGLFRLEVLVPGGYPASQVDVARPLTLKHQW